MNSVPKTNIQAGDFERLKPPFLIEQDHLGEFINNHVYDIDEEDNDGRQNTIAIFRVYPKGQNPMSKLRNQNQLRDLFTKQALQTVRNYTNIGIEVFGDSYPH